MDGRKLANDLTEATGLPQDLITDELQALLRKAGVSPETLSLENLRAILAEYLQDVFLEMKENLEIE